MRWSRSTPDIHDESIEGRFHIPQFDAGLTEIERQCKVIGTSRIGMGLMLQLYGVHMSRLGKRSRGAFNRCTLFYFICSRDETRIVHFGFIARRRQLAASG